MTARTYVARIGACQGCGACLRTCPEHAIRPTRGGLTVRDERCTGCGECVEVCPVDVIRLRPRPGPDVPFPDAAGGPVGP